MARRSIRRDDEVIVISGKDRGKTGGVLRVDPAKNKVFVEGLEIVKRHQRPQHRGRPDGVETGGVSSARVRSTFPTSIWSTQGQQAHARRHRVREEGRLRIAPPLRHAASTEHAT